MPLVERARLEKLSQALGDQSKLDVPLASYSWAGIGGPADLLFVAASRAALLKAVQAARDLGVPWRVFGGLTNMLLPDSGLRGAIILNHARPVHFDAATCRVHAESGAIVVKLAREAVRRGWGGLTWAVGLPGTIGGAVVNNAGAFGGEISKSLLSAQVFGSEGECLEVAADWFEFRYRGSKLKGPRHPWLVLSATFQLKVCDIAPLQAKADDYTERRQRTQPLGRTLGSTFKNPPGDYAGRLIDVAGLRGHRIGGFVVSEKHGNFFINDKGGKAADYKALIQLAQDEVSQRFGIQLETEIEIMPEEPALLGV